MIGILFMGEAPASHSGWGAGWAATGAAVKPPDATDQVPGGLVMAKM
jgi:hypothetical protein